MTEFYCSRCAVRVSAQAEVLVNERGSKVGRASCPHCGQQMLTYLGKA